MDKAHKRWNERQKQLQAMLTGPEGWARGLELFMIQHAEVHSAAMSTYGLVSFEDEVLDGLSEHQLKLIPEGFEQSIAWNWWHLARIEDVTMSMLVANEGQLVDDGRWQERLSVEARHTGNLMGRSEIETLSKRISIPAVKEYRQAVGRRTEAFVRSLNPDDLNQKVDSARLDHVLSVGAVSPQAQDLIEYWGRQTIAGLLLMPPTKHCLVHLNQATKIRDALIQPE